MAHRLLRRAKPTLLAAAAAAAGVAYSFPSSVDHASDAGASGHLGLVRAHPGLSELNALLTQEAFVLDATYALAAGVLRDQPLAGPVLRMTRAGVSDAIALAETRGDAALAADQRRRWAILDLRDGRFDAALDVYARLAGERPDDYWSRICAAAVCFLLGRHEEGNRWLGAVPENARHAKTKLFQDAVVRATLGGAPVAAPGNDELVMYAACELINLALQWMLENGELSMVEKLQIRMCRAFLERAMANNSYKKQDGKAGIVMPVRDEISGR